MRSPRFTEEELVLENSQPKTFMGWLNYSKRHNNRYQLCIILRLCVPELEIFAGFICKQLFMGADLHDLALIKYGDLVAETTGG